MRFRLSARVLRHALNLWPPFLFAGIHVAELAPDWSRARVELRMRPWNRNYVGTHFGGSLFAMTDPFWMLLMLHAIGEDHIVWDRAAEISFEKPGRVNRLIASPHRRHGDRPGRRRGLRHRIGIGTGSRKRLGRQR